MSMSSAAGVWHKADALSAQPDDIPYNPDYVNTFNINLTYSAGDASAVTMIPTSL